MKNWKTILLMISFLSLSACDTLMTRGDVREMEQKRQMQDQVVNLQKSTADVSNRFSDIEDDLRTLHGRVDVVENKLSVSGKDREKAKSEMDKNAADNAGKIKLLQDELTKVNERLDAMTTEMNAMKQAAAEAQAEKAVPKRDLYEMGEEFFQKKDWRKAILNYQRFRDNNPKHKLFPEATYKIGVSFQELGMKDEARTFYDEVIGKYPNSAEAKKAKTRLKSLKK